MHRKILIPRGWKRRVESTIFQILALSHYSFTAVVARVANARDGRSRFRAEIDRLD